MTTQQQTVVLETAAQLTFRTSRTDYLVDCAGCV
jgi:hypothetical protein